MGLEETFHVQTIILLRHNVDYNIAVSHLYLHYLGGRGRQSFMISRPGQAELSSEILFFFLNKKIV